MKLSLEIRQTREILSYLTVKRRTQLGFIGILMIVGSLAEIASIGLVIPFLSALTSPESLYQSELFSPIINYFGISAPEQLLLPFTLIFIIAVIFSGVVRLAILYVTIHFAHTVGHDLGMNLYRRTLYQSYSYHANQNSSEIINGIVIKINTITGGVIQPLLFIASSFLLMVGIVIALMFVDIVTSISALFVFGVLYFVVIRLTHKQIRNNSQNIAYHSTQLIKSIQEGLGGIRNVLIDNTQNFFCKIYKNSDISLRKATGDNSFIAGSPRFIMEVIGMTLIALLAYSLTVSSRGFEYVIPTLGALALGAQRLLPTMQQLYSAYSKLKSSQASLTDVLNLLSRDLPNYIDLPAFKPLNLKKDIVLKNVNFRYSEDSPWVLNNINLRFKMGSRIGFAGETGSGKSTLLDILMGLISPTEGELLVDDVVINSDNRHNWWTNIAHVPQSIYLSDNTIKENIAFGIDDDDINYSNVKNAAKLAKIDKLIEEWPKGYQTSIGERGVRLSGGQKQRIGIARALYKNINVLVFDEATSSLDNKTEHEVMESIENLDENLTVFIIAHRLTTLKKCDIIHVVEKGKIIKSVTYSELLKNTDLAKKINF
jgi:ATP-binding cassette, subfamily B, bacterial PglK